MTLKKLVKVHIDWDAAFSADLEQVRQAIAYLTPRVAYLGTRTMTITRWRFTPSKALLKQVVDARLHTSDTVFDFEHIDLELFQHVDLISLGSRAKIAPPADPNLGLYYHLQGVPTGHLCLYNNHALRNSINRSLLRAATNCIFALCLHDRFLGGQDSLLETLDFILGTRDPSALLIVIMRTDSSLSNESPLQELIYQRIMLWAIGRGVLMVTYGDVIRDMRRFTCPPTFFKPRCRGTSGLMTLAEAAARV